MLIKDYNSKFLKAFLVRCSSVNLREASIKQYLKVLNRFLAVYKTDTCNASDIMEYLSKLKVSPATKRIHYMSLSVYFNYLYKIKLLAENPMEAVERPRVPKKLQRFFSTEEIEAMLSCWDTSEYAGIRNKTIMLLFLGTGIRRAEMAGLLVSDIRWDLDLLIIRGKGGKERSIPLTAELRRILNMYLIKRKEFINKKKPCKSLFLSSNTGEGLTPAGIWTIFKKSPLTGASISPHSWRRTFARIFLLQGGDLVSLQLILGHASIDQTRKYIQLTGDDVAEVNNRCNPLSNKKWKYL